MIDPEVFLEHTKWSVVIRWTNKTTDACIEWNDVRRVSINLYQMVARAYIHEMIHFSYPKWSEKRVLKEEARQMNLLKRKDIIRIAVTVLEEAEWEEV